jgi:hypothetical protein
LIDGHTLFDRHNRDRAVADVFSITKSVVATLPASPSRRPGR